MTELSHYPNGRQFCGYADFIASAKRRGLRYGFARDAETGAVGLFVEDHIFNARTGRFARSRKRPSLMRATGRMTGAATEIVWK